EEVVGSISTLLEQPMSIAGADGETHEVSAERRHDWISVTPAEDGQSLDIVVAEEVAREWGSARGGRDAVAGEGGSEQVEEGGEVVKVVTENQDGPKITTTDAIAEELIAALKGVTPLEAAFESTTVEAEVEQVDAPKDEDEGEEDQGRTED